MNNRILYRACLLIASAVFFCIQPVDAQKQKKHARGEVIGSGAHTIITDADFIEHHVRAGQEVHVHDSLTGVGYTKRIVLFTSRFMRYTIADTVYADTLVFPDFWPGYIIDEKHGDYELLYSGPVDKAEQKIREKLALYRKRPDRQFVIDSLYQAADSIYQIADGIFGAADYSRFQEALELDEESAGLYRLAAMLEMSSTDVGNASDTTLVFVSPQIYDNEDLALNLDSLINLQIANYSADPRHKALLFFLVDTQTVVLADTIALITYDKLGLRDFRDLPVKPFIQAQLIRFGVDHPVYIREMLKPMTHAEVYNTIRNTYDSLNLERPGIEELVSKGVDPYLFLADVVYINYLLPYYAKYIVNAEIRAHVSQQLQQNLALRIREFRDLTGYDFSTEPVYRGLISKRTYYSFDRYSKMLTDQFGNPVEGIDPTQGGNTDYRLSVVKNNVFAYSSDRDSTGTFLYHAHPRFNSKYEVDEEGKILIVNGKPVLKKTFAAAVSFDQLNVDALAVMVRNLHYEMNKRHKKGFLINAKVYFQLKDTGRLE